jgi:hypothetical protein
MHDTLFSLVERALTGNQRPLEFYLRDQSRLPGPRPNMELANDISNLLAVSVPRYPENVRSLLNYFVNGDRKMVAGNTPSEFVMLCGVIAYGSCTAVYPSWLPETLSLLDHYASSPYGRIREGVELAFRSLLEADPQDIMTHLMELAIQGSYLQQRVAIATVSEPVVLYTPDILIVALKMQRVVLERLHRASADSKNEAFRLLRRTLGYTLSVITAAAPEEGFALMKECAVWNDPNITWILRENLKKKRLAKFAQHAEEVTKLLT